MNIILSEITELNFGEALLVLVLGLLVILGVLSLLIGLLYIIKYAVAAIERPREKKKEVRTPAAEVSAEDDEETVAAITAAIACILNEEHKTEAVVPPFKIKKIKQIR